MAQTTLFICLSIYNWQLHNIKLGPHKQQCVKVRVSVYKENITFIYVYIIKYICQYKHFQITVFYLFQIDI